MKKLIFVIFSLFSLFSCVTNNKEIRMQEVTVFENYTVKLPIQANLHQANRWKIESTSSKSMTIIMASELTQKYSIENCMNAVLMKHNPDKFKLHLNSKEEIEKPDFNIHINNYKGSATSPITISLTLIILDELNSQRRFVFELSSVVATHTYMSDSIVSSFKRDISSSPIPFEEREGFYQTFNSAGFKINCNCKLFDNVVFINMAKEQGINNIIGAYTCAENEDNPDIAVITNINIYDLSENYKGFQSDSYAHFEKTFLEQYADDLKQANIAFKKTEYLGVAALEYTFDQMSLPTKAIVFLKDKKSYLIQVGSRNNLNTKYNLLKNSFDTL